MSQSSTFATFKMGYKVIRHGREEGKEEYCAEELQEYFKRGFFHHILRLITIKVLAFILFFLIKE